MSENRSMSKKEKSEFTRIFLGFILLLTVIQMIMTSVSSNCITIYRVFSFIYLPITVAYLIFLIITRKKRYGFDLLFAVILLLASLFIICIGLRFFYQRDPENYYEMIYEGPGTFIFFRYGISVVDGVIKKSLLHDRLLFDPLPYISIILFIKTLRLYKKREKEENEVVNKEEMNQSDIDSKKRKSLFKRIKSSILVFGVFFVVTLINTINGVSSGDIIGTPFCFFFLFIYLIVITIRHKGKYWFDYFFTILLLIAVCILSYEGEFSFYLLQRTNIRYYKTRYGFPGFMYFDWYKILPPDEFNDHYREVFDRTDVFFDPLPICSAICFISTCLLHIRRRKITNDFKKKVSSEQSDN